MFQTFKNTTYHQNPINFNEQIVRHPDSFLMAHKIVITKIIEAKNRLNKKSQI